MITTEQHIDLDPHKYFEVNERDDVIPLDPVTGDALRAGVIPESLLADDELQRGYAYLQDHAAHIRAKILLSAHETSTDLAEAGIELGSEAKELANKSGVLFLEGVQMASAKARFQELLNHISTLQGEEAETMRNKIHAVNSLASFTAACLSQLTGSGVEIAQPDYTYNSDRPADRALEAWHETMETVIRRPDISLHGVDQWQSMNVGYTLYRDWYLVGKVGSYLAAREGSASRQADKVNVGMLVGSTHANIGKHLEGFGAEVEYVGAAEDAYAPHLSRLVNAVGNAALTLNDRIDQASDTMQSSMR
jgi:hypothetical protein